MIRPIEFSSVRGGPSVDYVVYTFPLIAHGAGSTTHIVQQFDGGKL